MGNCVQRILNKLRRKRRSEKNIVLLIVGLDNAGKTSVLNCIKGDPDQSALPTMGFRTVSLRYKSYSVTVYDLGGNSQIRSLWSKYYNDIHGVIYVVDGSDISRLTENKVIFGELISHEHISGKPILLLANKQDMNGAIDELDLVENLDVERAANTTRCPTRVETCSCHYDRNQPKNNTMGIINGYKWLLDTILKNYTALNNRIKDIRSTSERRIKREISLTNTPSKLSIHSNPFKPIKELILQKEQVEKLKSSQNGNDVIRKHRNIFMRQNKTAPFPSHHPTEEANKSASTTLTANNVEIQQYDQTRTVLLNPTTLYFYNAENKSKLIRPYTAPECSRLAERVTVINIPGQVPL